jgi:hypothetical protein
MSSVLEDLFRNLQREIDALGDLLSALEEYRNVRETTVWDLSSSLSLDRSSVDVRTPGGQIPRAPTSIEGTMARIRILSRDGVQFAEVDDIEASMLGAYWNAVRKFLYTGDDDALGEFEDEEVARIRLETDPDWIEYWARRGDLEFEDIYEG